MKLELVQQIKREVNRREERVKYGGTIFYKAYFIVFL
jgi:hypothetical protein